MAIIVPAQVSVQTLGNVKVAAVVAIANTAAPSLATEVNASTSIDFSCALTNDGFKPTADQGKTNKKRRMCATSDTEFLQPAQYSFEKLMYSVGDPQSEDSAIIGLMVEGVKLYLVERLGIDADTAFAAGQKVRVHYVQLGAPVAMYDPSSDSDEFLKSQTLVYVNGTKPVAGVIAA